MDISRIGANNNAQQPDAKQVSIQLQAMFMEILIESMESTVEAEEGLFGKGAAADVYRSLFRKDLALSLAREVGGGLREQVQKSIEEKGMPERLEEIPGALPSVVPNALPIRGTITSPMGWRRDPINGEMRYHAGTDIAAPQGTPIHAVAEGVVVESGARGGYGNAVVVESEDGRRMLYAHNALNTVNVGDRVARGQLIAYVGSTGRSTGPHIHFEVEQ